MKCFKPIGLSLGLLLCSLWLYTHAFAAEPLRVVTSFSILEDLVKQVGGDSVVVSNLVKAGNDAHTYEPSARDTQALAKADLLFINGLDFETWIPRLKAASGFRGKEIVVSTGIVPRRFHPKDDHDVHGDHEHSEYDPHAWQNVQNVIIYVKNIEQALSEADPENQTAYRQRAQQYMAQLSELDDSIHTAFAGLPAGQRTIAMTHEAFGYFADAYGFQLIAIMSMSPDEEPTAAGIAQFVKQIRQQHISAIFLENMTNTRLLEQIAKDTGLKVGGVLYTDALSAPGTTASSYLEMMQSNRDTLLQALSASH